MTESIFDPTQDKAARIAGFSYLLTLATVVIVNYAVTFRFVIPGNIVETTQNILANDQLFRLNVALNLIYAGGIVVLLTSLYVVLAPLGRGLALLAALFRFVYAIMWIVITLSLFSLLRLLNSADSAILLNSDRLPVLTLVFLGIGSNAYTIGLVFWGLASAVCAFQLLGSGYVPKFLAIWGIISSVWCALCGIGVMSIQNFGKTIDPSLFDVPMVVFEIAIAILFIRRGVRPNQSFRLTRKSQRSF